MKILSGMEAFFVLALVHPNWNMSVHEFIFSKQKSHRLKRHLVFWGLYILLFYAQGLVEVQNQFFVSLVSVISYIPAVVMSVYVFSQILCPWLQQKKYLRVLSGFSVLLMSIWIVNSLGSVVFFHFTCDCPISTVNLGALVALTSINSTHAVIAGAMIFGYKMGREWFLKQLENQRLVKQKIDHALHLQKARLYPTFLLQSLNSLYTRIQSASPDAPEITLKLSDLLSYLLYESDDEWIPVKNEVAMINNLVSLENVNQCDHVSIQSELDGSGNKMIRPLILFPLLHDCFNLIARRKEELHVNVQLFCTDNKLNMSVFIEHVAPLDGVWLHDLVADARRRSDYLYQKNTDINISQHPQGMQLRLNIQLADAP